MGAAAGKQFQSEKAKHAQAVLSAVRNFEEGSSPVKEDEDISTDSPVKEDEDISTEFFKRKVMLAATDAKRRGKDIEKSLAQLTDADFETLAHYAEAKKDEERRKALEQQALAMTLEEIGDDDVAVPNAASASANADAADNIDETTSVLSYGDEEEGGGQEDGEMDSSGSMVLNRSASMSLLRRENSGEILENLDSDTGELIQGRPRKNSGYKVFPLSSEGGAQEGKSRGGGAGDSSDGEMQLKLKEENLRPGVADAFAKFWDMDDMASIAATSPPRSSSSPIKTEASESTRKMP
eukprot:CAMPEP_0174987850 /NCGR_PEP_ID=MMETSP0004_2-20121128/19786_1 /TAXON_ID=420556 /ORGANISM="Ochromonas sp., Strain CCMP1393" /LENGTH=294 /DNA_ID=CAMNT_0016240975 /DNA_START=46 /DNA_END=926 /DNA_ORIENTATION=+